MSNRTITIPDPVRQKITTLGAEGLIWLTNLDNLISDLEQEWSISIESGIEGGSEAYVAQARNSDGSKVILKVAIPEYQGNTALANEITALKIAGGHGYVRLLRSDLNRRVLLLEPLGTPLKDLGYSTRTQIEIICKTLRESWIPLSSDESGLPSGATIAQWHSGFITGLWESLNKPCSRQALDMALSFAQARAKSFHPKNSVLVHGDAHNGNTLQCLSHDPQTSHSFKFIDPDGIVAEAACDLGILMREWIDELIANPVRLGLDRCTYLSHLAGVDAQAIWQWGFIQCMSTGLLLIQIGQVQTGTKMLQVAEAWTSI